MMADDTAEINGVAADSVQVNVEGLFSCLVGCGLALYFCWKVAIATIICIPVFGFGLYIQALFMRDARDKSKGS